MRRRGRTRRRHGHRSLPGGEISAGRLRFACEDPDAPENFPRVLTVWRANLLVGQGNEYFLRPVLGTDSAVRANEAPPCAASCPSGASSGDRGDAAYLHELPDRTASVGYGSRQVGMESEWPLGSSVCPAGS